MKVFDQFFTKFAYKFDKGYPDINNNQDVLLLESLISEVVGGKFTLSEVTEEDSPNLPDDISQLKIDIQAIPGLDNVTTVKKAGGRNY